MRARRRRDAEPVDPGALAALTGLFVQAAVDNVTRAPALYLLGAVCLGIVIAVEAPSRRSVRPAWRLLVATLLLYLFVVGEGVQFLVLIHGAFATPAAIPEGFGGYRQVGTVLFTDYVLAFEATSLLLLAAMVGAVILAKRKID